MLPEILKSIIKGLLGLIFPLILIVAGAGLFVLGLMQSWTILMWTGVVVMLVGIGWVLFIYYE